MTETTQDIIDTLEAAGFAYAGNNAAEMADEWESEPLNHSVSDWVSASVWNPQTACQLESDGLTPHAVQRISEQRMHDGREYAGGTAIYALCNDDLTIEEFRYRTAYRVMEHEPGSAARYLGEEDTEDAAVTLAESDPAGTPESEWGLHRAAGTGTAPDASAIIDEDYEPSDWYGESGWICIEPVRYDLG